ncbi:hypothetical protein LR48_Vigan10g114300 [Vigna angularis]|uniref:Uncharacterized protein n=1 Tax=Phaseolus angularis TaxID=3914 RepID=A0A0L9VJM6_PHAAN|nr:hypothetical protein LR48_Vigan10g114300 [Vigna angularis]
MEGHMESGPPNSTSVFFPPSHTLRSICFQPISVCFQPTSVSSNPLSPTFSRSLVGGAVVVRGATLRQCVRWSISIAEVRRCAVVIWCFLLVQVYERRRNDHAGHERMSHIRLALKRMSISVDGLSHPLKNYNNFAHLGRSFPLLPPATTTTNNDLCHHWFLAPLAISRQVKPTTSHKHYTLSEQ